MSEKPAEEPPKEAPAEGEPVEGEEAKAEGAVEGEEVPEEEKEPEFHMAEDECYPDDHVEKTHPDSALSRRSMKFFQTYGQTSYKRYNYHWLGDECFIFAAGNTYQIFNMETKERRIFHATDTDGVGSVTVHPNKKHFVVAEKGNSPNIYIYEYPSLKLYRVLRKGTEKMYAHVEFSANGGKLASLGGAPDYTLTVWDWVNQRVILKNKAMSQEVFKCGFSPWTDDVLFTGGIGHVKFWKMAQTFTGLKLQGEVAKFGSLELSNISTISELPDGKCITGTQYGTIIIWEGQFVKTHLVKECGENDDDFVKLHEGPIEVLIQTDDFFITSGGDGWVRWWNKEEIDNAEADEGLNFEMKPVKEMLVTSGVKGQERTPAFVMTMIKGPENKWFCQDKKGNIVQFDEETGDCVDIWSFHQGSINDVVASPSQNYVLTIGEDGMTKCWDYVGKKVQCEKQFNGAGLCMEHMAHTDANKGRVCAAGFDNGVIRILSMTEDDMHMLKAFKAHDDPIAVCRYSKDLKMFVTGSVKGDIFFFECDGSKNLQLYDPLCTLHLADTKINDAFWTDDDKAVILACDNGYIYQVRRPSKDEIDNSETYYWHNAEVKEWCIKIMEFQMQKNQQKDPEEEEKKRRMRLRGELPPEEEEEEEVWNPAPLRTIIPYDAEDGTKQYLVSTEGQFGGFMYVCNLDVMRPLKAIPCSKGDTLITSMKASKDAKGEVITITYTDGEVEVVVDRKFERRMSIKNHDVTIGHLTATTFNRDDSFFFTVGQDGLIFVYQFDKDAAVEEVKYDPLTEVEGANFLPPDEKEKAYVKKLNEYHEKNPTILPEPILEEHGLDEPALAVTLKTNEPVNVDIADPTMYSIQQSKLRTEEDHRLSLAEQKKNKEKIKINKLREEFTKLVDQNNSAEPHLRIGEDDFQIDAEYFLILAERNDGKISETKKEEAFDIEKNTLALNKFKNKFVDVLEFDKFMVKSVRSNAYVNTFRVQRMSEFLQTNIESFKQMLENEIIGKDADEGDDFGDDASKDGENVVDLEKQKEKEKKEQLLAKQKAAAQALADQKKTEAEKKREARKIEREKRWHEIEKLRRLEVMQNDEDEEGRKAIEEARATYGDYKLKLDPMYTVPENQRINYSKKRQQMILLQGSIHKLKVDFNQKIQELKIRKKQICEHVGKLNVRLTAINDELNVKEELVVPTIDIADEYPENFYECTDQDVEDYKVRLEKAEEAKKQKNLSKTQKAQIEAEAAAKAAADKAKEEEEEEEEQDEKPKVEVIDYDNVQVVARKGAQTQASEFDTEYDQIRQIELGFERDQKKAEVENLISSFDNEISEMQKEKYRLESDLKNAEMKFVLFYEQLILLKSMESKDQKLTKSLSDCRKDKGNILRDINEITRSLKIADKDIASIDEREKELEEKFYEFCPERNDKHAILKAYYEKTTKRRRKPEKVEKADDEEDEENEEDEPEEEEDDDEDEDEEEENAIAGLSQEDYRIDEIDRLKDQRMELYDQAQAIRERIKTMDEKRRRLEATEKNIKQALTETEEEIQDFQSEKMSKLNELKQAIVLKTKQIQNLVPNLDTVDYWEKKQRSDIQEKIERLKKREEEEGLDEATVERLQRDILSEQDWRGFLLPKDLNDSILFTRTQLLQLIDRKREIEEEITEKKRELEADKLTMGRKEKEIKQHDKIKAEKKRAYDEKRMLRFGNVIELEALEVGGPSAVVLELQNKFAKTEKECFANIEEAEGKLAETQRDLTDQMKRNTGLLDLIRNLGERELQLDHKLTDANKAIFVDEDEAKKARIREEKNKIKELLQTQAKEIETFKTEINMYKRKGGHIYTKVTTNRRVANLNQDN